jgi:hypothetical protein
MALIKALRLKEPRYRFRVWDNESAAAPMVCVFRRFPLPDETYSYARKEDISDRMRERLAGLNEQPREEAVALLVEAAVDLLVENIERQRVDYGRFIRTCVARFENIEYEGRRIESVEAFLGLPDALVYTLAADAYAYAVVRDEFTLDEKN